MERTAEIQSAIDFGMSLGRKFEDSDLQVSGDLAMDCRIAAGQYILGYEGYFSYMVDLKAKVVKNPACLSISQRRGALNCLMAEVRHEAQKQVEAEQIANQPPTQWVGEVGDKIDCEMVIESAVTRFREFGTGGRGMDDDCFTIVKMHDLAGHQYVWFASGERGYELGQTFMVTGRVKGHGEFKGVKETQLTRCRVKDSDAVAV